MRKKFLKYNFTTEQKTEIVNHYLSGLSLQAVGKLYGCGYKPIAAVLAETKTPIRHGKILESKNQEEIGKLYLSGKTSVELSKLFDCNKRDILHILNKLNIPRRGSNELSKLRCELNKTLSTKKCSKCKETKLKEEFYKLNSSASGYSPKCKECSSKCASEKLSDPEYNKTFNAKRRETRDREYDKEYRIKNKKRFQVRDALNYQKREFKEKRTKTNNIWSKKNPLKKRLHLHRRRAKKLGLINIHYTIEQMITMYGSVCVYCHEEPFEEIDHYIPISRGGHNTLENVRPACRFCNRSKGAKTAEEFLEFRKLLGRDQPTITGNLVLDIFRVWQAIKN